MEYRMLDDEFIYEIQKDGSCKKIARIEDNGYVHILPDLVSKKTKNRKGLYWIFIILFATCSTVLGYLYLLTSTKIEYYETKFYKKCRELFVVNSQLEDISELYPLVVNDIQISNQYKDGSLQTDYGDIIYSNSTMFLAPKIFYTGLNPGTKRLKVKWYMPNGQVKVADNSFEGFSQSFDVNIHEGSNELCLLGWGYEIMGYWSSGLYRIEIWYEDCCLKSKTFEIY